MKQLIRLRATQHVHIGMQADGTVLSFEKEGEEKTVIHVPQLDFYVKHKILEKIDDNGGVITKKLHELEKFVNAGFVRIIWAEKLLEKFESFDKFLKEVTCDDIAILPGTTKQFSEDMMLELKPKEVIAENTNSMKDLRDGIVEEEEKERITKLKDTAKEKSLNRKAKLENKEAASRKKKRINF